MTRTGARIKLQSNDHLFNIMVNGRHWKKKKIPTQKGAMVTLFSLSQLNNRTYGHVERGKCNLGKSGEENVIPCMKKITKDIQDNI